jgi:protein-disulfide isomerase
VFDWGLIPYPAGHVRTEELNDSLIRLHPSFGPRADRIEIAVFSDYLCQVCATLFAEFPGVLAQVDVPTTVDWLAAPGVGQLGLELYRVAECLDPLVGGDEVRTALFAVASDIMELRRGLPDSWIEVAAELGADRPRDVDSCVAGSVEVEREIRNQQELAALVGVAGTPTLVVNGAVIEGYPGARALKSVLRSSTGLKR